jgi:hypothetical protein
LAVLLHYDVVDDWAVDTVPPEFDGWRASVRFRLKKDPRGDKGAYVEFTPGLPDGFGAMVCLNNGGFCFELSRIYEGWDGGRTWGLYLSDQLYLEDADWINEDDLGLVLMLEALLQEKYVRAFKAAEKAAKKAAKEAQEAA